MKISTSAFLALLLALPMVCGAQSDEDIDASTETTHDGLVQVRRAGFRNVWVKPGVDISAYTKIFPGPTQFHYRDVRPVSRRAASRASEFPIEENSRARLEEAMTEAFREELSESEHFELVDETGPDVLLIFGSLHDIVSNVPPDQVGRTRIYLSRVGQATLVLQIEDFMSREVLARVVDRRAADPAFARQSNRVANMAEVRRLAQTWARLMTRGLDRWVESGGVVE
jgi:hypothetical protein